MHIKMVNFPIEFNFDNSWASISVWLQNLYVCQISSPINVSFVMGAPI